MIPKTTGAASAGTEKSRNSQLYCLGPIMDVPVSGTIRTQTQPAAEPVGGQASYHTLALSAADEAIDHAGRFGVAEPTFLQVHQRKQFAQPVGSSVQHAQGPLHRTGGAGDFAGNVPVKVA